MATGTEQDLLQGNDRNGEKQPKRVRRMTWDAEQKGKVLYPAGDIAGV